MLTDLFPELTIQNSDSKLPPLENYELLHELGRGAHGIVYEARHRSLDHRVAIKILAAGPFASIQGQTRFLREARTAASLRHPNIVRVLEFGNIDGCFWFAMDLVVGNDLAATLKEKPLAPPLAGRWIAQIARAIHHTHERGVIHRDIKPSNILIGADGNPHLTDFGLASVQDAMDLTVSNQAMGTFHYTSPEQVTDASSTTRSTDVYALGAVLYHCLAGRPPFAGSTVPELLRAVIELTPVPPSQINLATPRDLEKICLKCLEKDPALRYATGEGLANDLDRFLEGEPVLAKPVSRINRAIRWAKRKPVLTVLSVLLFSTLLISTVISLQQNRYARQLVQSGNSSRIAAASADCAVEHKTIKEMLLSAEQETQAGNINEALARIAWILRRPDTAEIAGGWCRALLNQPLILPLSNEISLSSKGVIAVFDSSGNTLLTAHENGLVQLWNAEGRPTQIFATNFPPPITKAIFSHDSMRIAITASNGLHLLSQDAPGHEGDEADSPYRIARDVPPHIIGHHFQTRSQPQSFGFSSDSLRLAVGSEDGTLTIFNLLDHRPLWSQNAHSNSVRALAWSRSGERLLTGGADGWVKVWENLKNFPAIAHQHRSPISAVAWSGDETLLAYGADDGNVGMYDRNGPVPFKTPSPLPSIVTYLAFHPMEPTFVSADANGTARLLSYKERPGIPPRRFF